MTTNELIKYIQKWALEFQARIDELVDGLDKRVQGLQRDLVRRFLDVVMDMFEFEDGRLKKSNKNLSAIKKLYRLFDGFSGSIVAEDIRLFAIELLEVGAASGGYFRATNPAATEEMTRKALGLMRGVIGINETGGLAVDGYLYRLGIMMEVREQLRQYVVQSILGRRTLAEFTNGFKALVVGRDGIDGALQAYWRQYAYDTYNQAHEVVNSTMAESLGMTFFVYQGSIIQTTRNFCRTRAGNVYSVPETATWKDDQDLIEKKTKESYNPLIERGRYNCRHFINYISNELALGLRPELKK